jgi:tRNA dimethylallyltransferase
LANCGFLSPLIMSIKSKYLIAVVGPTAVGKTPLAIDLALKYDAEIISADSRQLYREFDVAVAKPAPAELGKVPHHFVGSVSIHDDYDAAKFGEDALHMIGQLHAHHQFAVLCGGSGLYIRSLLEGFDAMPHVPDEVRQRIIDSYEANGIEWLQAEVEAADPDYFEVVDRKNPQRLMRALEVIQAAGLRPSTLRTKKKRNLPFQVIKIGLHLDRALLYERIDQRVDQMVANGIFEEASRLFPFRSLNALQTVGYQEIFGHMEGQYDREEAIRLLKRNTRRYAKRQMTWFRKDTEIKWFQPDQWDELLQYIQQASAKSDT